MLLEEALLDFTNNRINELKDKYLWGVTLMQDIPFADIVIDHNQSLYEQNKQLRHLLSDKFNSNNITKKEKYNIIRWYIYHWGGVKTNNEETLKKYTNSSFKNLKQLGQQGVASWSKALSIKDPLKYAIYDARVASSLNLLQIIYKVHDPLYFPSLSSRNSVIAKSNSDRETLFKSWRKLNPRDFYENYLQLLNKVVIKSGSKITSEDLEMLLFALAEELVNEVNKKIQSHILIYLAIHKDKNSAYGVTIPELSGCFSAGNSIENAVINSKEAIDLHIKGVLEDHDKMIITHRTLDELKQDSTLKDAFFVGIEFNISDYFPRVEYINISQ